MNLIKEKQFKKFYNTMAKRINKHLIKEHKKRPFTWNALSTPQVIVQKPVVPFSTINPAHYRQHPSKVECIQITEHMNFCLGNAVKYIWRAGLKNSSPLEDLEKARWYLDREIERVKKEAQT